MVSVNATKLVMSCQLFVLYNILFNVISLVVANQDSYLTFGSIGPKLEVPAVDGWPEDSASFLNEYVVGSKPLLFRGAAKQSPAYTRWTDEYFLTLEDAEHTEVTVETEKKENRTQSVVVMLFNQFVEVYTTGDLYMVDSVPDFLRNDVLLPLPLQCQELQDVILETIMWFSSGGTKSVLHFDAVDNINCVYSGSKEIYLIDPAKYADKVTIDHPEGNYCGVDVDRVNYTMYPGLREVEYYHANIEEGDCFYIPFKWFHQVRSQGRNIAVNIWFSHFATLKQDLQKCRDIVTMETDNTLADYDFPGLNSLNEDIEIIREMLTDLVRYRGVSTDEGLIKVLGKEHVNHMPTASVPGLHEIISKIFLVLDENSDERLVDEEVSTASYETWTKVKELFHDFEDFLSSIQDEESIFEDEIMDDSATIGRDEL